MSETWEQGRHPGQAEVHEPVEPEDRPERLPAFDEIVDEMRAALAEIDIDELDEPARTFVERLREAVARYDAAGRQPAGS